MTAAPTCPHCGASLESFTTLRLGDIVLNLLTRRGFRKRDLDLSVREFELLAFFMRRPGQTTSRAAVREAVWPSLLGGSNVVDVYVSALRRKLGDDGHRLLRTIQGEGYVMVKEQNSPQPRRSL